LDPLGQIQPGGNQLRSRHQFGRSKHHQPKAGAAGRSGSRHYQTFVPTPGQLQKAPRHRGRKGFKPPQILGLEALLRAVDMNRPTFPQKRVGHITRHPDPGKADRQDTRDSIYRIPTVGRDNLHLLALVIPDLQAQSLETAEAEVGGCASPDAEQEKVRSLICGG
jgi:hypothetical protein